MSLFSFNDVTSLYLKIDLPETEKHYVMKMLNEMPITNLKTTQIKERRDTLTDILELVPRYEISGQKIEISFYDNKLVFMIGENYPPFMKKKKEKIFVTNEQLDKYDIDINYLLGVVFKVTNKTYKDAKIESRVSLSKKKYRHSFEKIINNQCLKEINRDALIDGVYLKLNKDTKLSIRYDDDSNETSINYEKSINLNGPINTNIILDNSLSDLNDSLLKL